MCEPRFEHDCRECVFLGSYNTMDLYTHQYERAEDLVLITRFGSGGDDYLSARENSLKVYPDDHPMHELWRRHEAQRRGNQLQGSKANAN